MRRAIFQLAAWYRKLLHRTTGLWLGHAIGRVGNSAMFRSRLSFAGMRMAYFTPWAFRALRQEQFVPIVGAVDVVGA
jgi:hypothetical protein